MHPTQKAGLGGDRSVVVEEPSTQVLVQRCRSSVHAMIGEMLSLTSYPLSMIAAIHSIGGNPLLLLADPARSHRLVAQTAPGLTGISRCMEAGLRVFGHSRQETLAVRWRLHQSRKSPVLACRVVFLFLRSSLLPWEIPGEVQSGSHRSSGNIGKAPSVGRLQVDTR